MSLDSSEVKKNNALKKEATRFFEYFHSLQSEGTIPCLVPTRCVGIHADRAAVCSTRRVDTAFHAARGNELFK